MKTSKLFSNRAKATAACPISKSWLAAALVILVGLSCDLPLCRAQSPDGDVAGATVLTRGPVHEAFAGIVTYDAEPGVVISKAPPAVIEEMPPEERPEGDNVTWIPGYWAWDDERTDFLWVSGTWRALPPGREWMAGYWGQTSQGYQWTSGYWADASARETTYLPAPPATVEVGPNIAAPSDDYGWTPGCWVWYSGHYAWRPGYWVQGRADWDWSPSYYVWTPRGYIYVDGFWDYPVERRGVLFAPVYFESSVYVRHGYYSPTIVIGLDVFSDHLFLRPRYHHYYFGDYYAPSYYQGGFYASFSFQSSRYGYDPIYSHQRWEHRRDREWEHHVEVSYQNRRDHEDARPPRTWAAQRNIAPSSAGTRENRPQVATSFDQMAKRKDGPMKFQPVAKAERQQLAQRGQEVQKSRDERRTLEAKVVDTAAPNSGRAVEPTKVKLPRSPIVGKSANQLGRGQTPPQAQQAPKPDSKSQPKAEKEDRRPNVDRSNPQPQPGRPESEKRPTPRRNDVAPLERQAQPESPQPQPQPRAKESEPKAPANVPRKANGIDRQTPPQSVRPANDAAIKAQDNSPRNTRALEPKVQPAPEPRANDSTVKAREVAPRNASGANRPPRVSEHPAKEKPAAGEKGASRLMRNDRQQQGKGQTKQSDDPKDSPRR